MCIKFNLIFLLITFHSLAQSGDLRRTYNWHFGNGNAIDFSSGTPQNISGSQIFTREGSASISDACGELLFYTNGDTVWNRNHQIMPNGSDLLGPNYFLSSAQACLIIPQPSNDSIYFIFTNDEAENFGERGFRYSMVNMNLDGGLGDLVTKNILLYEPSMEMLGATYHQNGLDYWVVSREIDLSNFINDRYVAHLVSSTGVSSQPVHSYTGGKYGGLLGYLRFNEGGSKMACAMNGTFNTLIDTIHIYDFDNITGIVSSLPIKLTADTGSVYGMCYSPDNSKLYASFYRWDQTFSKIVQYDLSSGNQAIIQSTLTVLDQSAEVYFGAIQIRPDHKLFVGKYNYYNNLCDSLSVIHSPNMAGISCNFQRDGFFVNNLNFSGGVGLPNFIDSYLYQSWIPPCTNSLPEMINQERKLIRIVNTMGIEVEDKPNTLLIYIYSDGTTLKSFRID